MYLNFKHDELSYPSAQAGRTWSLYVCAFYFQSRFIRSKVLYTFFISYYLLCIVTMLTGVTALLPRTIFCSTPTGTIVQKYYL